VQSDDPNARPDRQLSLDVKGGRPLNVYRRGKDMADRADSERYMNMARRWFTEGWAGNIALADDLFSEHVRTNGP
jgi:hypothetical protein